MILNIRLKDVILSWLLIKFNLSVPDDSNATNTVKKTNFILKQGLNRNVLIEIYFYFRTTVENIEEFLFLFFLSKGSGCPAGSRR